MTNYANRGMPFEKLIIASNTQYFHKGRATIQKVATPWKVIRRGNKIVSAFPEGKSTVDFVGVFNGRAIAFDAKSTLERTRFPLSNVEEHQVNFLTKWQQNGGIAFILVDFAKKKEVYMLSIGQLNNWFKKAKEGGRKSIPYDWFFMNCELVGSKNGILLDYLSIIESRLKN